MVHPEADEANRPRLQRTTSAKPRMLWQANWRATMIQTRHFGSPATAAANSKARQKYKSKLMRTQRETDNVEMVELSKWSKD
jgi:hypothetical protein